MALVGLKARWLGLPKPCQFRVVLGNRVSLGLF